MIIRALTIENFKGIGQAIRIEIKPITLLFGINSSGKSTIIQALHYTREILSRRNFDADHVVAADESLDLGGFENMVHNHNLNLPIRLKFELSYSPLADITNYFSKRVDNGWIEIEIKWSHVLSQPILISSSIGIDGEHFSKIVCDDDGNRPRISQINFKHHLLATSEMPDEDIDPDFKGVRWPNLLLGLLELIKEDYVLKKDNIELFIAGKSAFPRAISLHPDIIKQSDERRESPGDDSWDDIQFLKTTDKPSSEAKETWNEQEYQAELREAIEDFFGTYLGGLAAVLRDELIRFRYIGPIRKVPSRFFFGVRSENQARWSSGLAAWDLLYQSNRSFLDHLNEWMLRPKRLNTGYRIKLKKYKELDVEGPLFLRLRGSSMLDDIEEIYQDITELPEKRRLTLVEEANGIELQPHDIGIGISQLLPVVIAALDGTSGMLLVEQPELHIHPGLQAALGDLFISQVKEQDVCFLFETHSEHLLLRMLRRIRETHENDPPVDAPSLTPDKLSIHYIEQTEKGMSITPLQVDETGEFVNKWPRGFFEERDEELF